ncbi:hypothetical protein BKA70DRAFT_465137 [Coprinopsis sp. MPI-PUGE-AT-0042]|nr:hypothetical protein BKA70DRAFT_465137 [Coprinopsis sp. MPI-PUGE-AT-0042]
MDIPTHLSEAPSRSLRVLILESDDDDGSVLLQHLLIEDNLRFPSLEKLILASSGWNEPRATAVLSQLFDQSQDTLETYDLEQAEPQVFPKSLLRLDLIPNLRSLSLKLHWPHLECIPDQSDMMRDISKALELLAVPGNVLETFDLIISFKRLDDDWIEPKHIYLPQQWFEQWAALDNVMSSPHFECLLPCRTPTGQLTISGAAVALDFECIGCKYLPSPREPVEASLQILSEMKTLQITR